MDTVLAFRGIDNDDKQYLENLAKEFDCETYLNNGVYNLTKYRVNMIITNDDEPKLDFIKYLFQERLKKIKYLNRCLIAVIGK